MLTIQLSQMLIQHHAGKLHVTQTPCPKWTLGYIHALTVAHNQSKKLNTSHTVVTHFQNRAKLLIVIFQWFHHSEMML